MKIEKKTVDLNAYIFDLESVIKETDTERRLVISLKNKNHGIIVALRLICFVYDSFNDKIQFDGKDFVEIKKADLRIEPYKKESFYIDVDKNDMKKVDVSVTQIVYADGEKVIPKEPQIVEYEVEVLSSSWFPDNHFEKDALSIMQEKIDKAICFPKIHPKGWICVCGMLNSESDCECAGCGNNKHYVFSQFSIDSIKSEIEEREKREQKERERREEQQKIKQEKERRKKQLLISAFVLAIVIGIACAITYNIKYGLSGEEEIRYNIAKNNDFKIEDFVMVLGNKYNRVADKYHDIDYSNSHEQKSGMSEAEKNEDFLYLRGIYLASPLLYELIEEQYPEKYNSIYEQLTKLKKCDVYYDILIDETFIDKTLNVDNGRSDLLDMQDEIKKAIDYLEKYMHKDPINTTKVKIDNIQMQNPDYSKVYGINLGILYYEDGNIKYIGEVSNGQANGFGILWYSKDDGGKTCCEGIFEGGIFKSGEKCYDTEGNAISANELSGMVIEGDFEIVQGLSNTESSKSIAQQNVEKEEQDKLKAQTAVENYLKIIMKNQSSITNIKWFNIPDVIGDYYYYPCTVEYGELKREGIITVEKKSDGSFEATRLDFDD